MSEHKTRTCVECGTKGFSRFVLRTTGWLCSDCNPSASRPAASPEEIRAAFEALREAAK